MKKLSPYGPDPPSMSGIFKGTQRYRQIAKLAGTEDSTDPILLNPDVQRAIMGVEYMAKSFKEEEFYERSKAEWKYVAFVLDHCLLNVFIATCLLGSAAIFGENCFDLVTSVWHAVDVDGFNQPPLIPDGQDICFQYLNQLDQEGEILQQQKTLQRKILLES